MAYLCNMMENNFDPQERIAYLSKTLDEHNYNYYVLNAPTIDDREFDRLMHELEQLEAEYPQFASPDSPTRHVGSDINHAFVQVEHTYPMLSLSNTYSIEEVAAFYERVRLETEAFGGMVRQAEFGAEVELELLFPEKQAKPFLDRLTDLTAGTVEGMEIGQEYRAFPETKAE